MSNLANQEAIRPSDQIPDPTHNKRDHPVFYPRFRKSKRWGFGFFYWI